MFGARVLPIIVGSMILSGCSGNGTLAAFGEKAAEILSSVTQPSLKQTPNDAFEDKPYSFQLEVDDIDIPYGDTLAFSVVSLPQWLKLTREGLLQGVPQNADVGDVDVVVRVTDRGGKTDDANFTITVFNTNDDPYFITENLPPARQDEAYEYQIKAEDIDLPHGDVLRQRMLTGPDWLSVSADGAVSGTPSNADVGTFQIVVELSDKAGSKVQREFDITVENVNDSPVFLMKND